MCILVKVIIEINLNTKKIAELIFYDELDRKRRFGKGEPAHSCSQMACHFFRFNSFQ